MGQGGRGGILHVKARGTIGRGRSGWRRRLLGGVLSGGRRGSIGFGTAGQANGETGGYKELVDREGVRVCGLVA